MREKIKKAIKETLVIDNIQNIDSAVDKIVKLYSLEISHLHEKMIDGDEEETNNILKELLELPF